MRNSIRFKMTSILILIVGWVIVFTWLLNHTFSEKYYVSSEKESIVETFNKVKNILKNEEDQDTIDEEMEQISNKTNIKMMTEVKHTKRFLVTLIRFEAKSFLAIRATISGKMIKGMSCHGKGQRRITFLH